MAVFPETSRRQVVGWLAVFGSAFSFYMATVIIRWAGDYVAIETPFFVFARFLLGFFVALGTMAVGRQRFAPKNYHLLWGRTIANTIAVFCFYKAVEVTTLAEANILNMTYPIFVTIISWFLIKEQRDRFVIAIVAFAFIGVWLIISPGGVVFKLQNLWGLFSGITAAFAMIYLNLSRRCHDSQTILLFMFGCGALLIALFYHNTFFRPNLLELAFLLACSVAGVVGQYMLTYGFFFVTAVEGSIISSSRIFFAALLGPLMVGDPALGLPGLIGALLIFLANSTLAYRRVTNRSTV